MRKRDIILGTVIIGGVVLAFAWVAMSVYHHEYVGLATQLASRFAV